MVTPQLIQEDRHRVIADIKYPRSLATLKQPCVPFKRSKENVPLRAQESCRVLTELALFGRLKIKVGKDENLMP